MNQNDDADTTPRDQQPTEDHHSTATDTAAPALEVLRDPESGRVTFTIRDCDDSQKLTEWITIDSEHVVHPDDMQ
ncbi:DUF7511 domain-containing protein [Halorubellus litoreus]|uniref:DUF7511 domain-containing protein n=1 Tax=Halorubellus litoreus TaxID=755308 RepID=A0ABD5VLV2_9EURY